MLEAAFYSLFTQYPHWKWMIPPSKHIIYWQACPVHNSIHIRHNHVTQVPPSHVWRAPSMFHQNAICRLLFAHATHFLSFTPGWLVDCLSCICIANDDFLSPFVFLSRWVPFSSYLRSGKKVHSLRIISSERFACLSICTFDCWVRTRKRQFARTVTFVQTWIW